MMPMAFQSLSIQAGRWKVPKTLMLIIGDDSCLSNMAIATSDSYEPVQNLNRTNFAKVDVEDSEYDV